MDVKSSTEIGFTCSGKMLNQETSGWFNELINFHTIILVFLAFLDFFFLLESHPLTSVRATQLVHVDVSKSFSLFDNWPLAHVTVRVKKQNYEIFSCMDCYLE